MIHKRKVIPLKLIIKMSIPMIYIPDYTVKTVSKYQYKCRQPHITQ